MIIIIILKLFIVKMHAFNGLLLQQNNCINTIIIIIMLIIYKQTGLGYSIHYSLLSPQSPGGFSSGTFTGADDLFE